MKTLVLTAVAILASQPAAFAGIPKAAVAGAAPPAAVAFVGTADVAKALQGLSPKFTDDEPLRVIDAEPNRLGVFVVGRPKTTGPAQVDSSGAIKVTEGLQLDGVSAIVRVLDGVGTFVAGGTLAAPTRMRADDPDAAVIGPGQRGHAILGGQSRRLSAGDMVIVPAGVPHGFSEIESPLHYLVIRVDPGHVLPLSGPAFAQARNTQATSVKQSPFACDQLALNPEQRKRHFDVLGPALIAKRTSVRELPDGYEIAFPSDTETYKQAAEYVDGERACCPFFEISLRVTPEGGPMWLRFTGRPGTKQFIEGDGSSWISPVAGRK